MTWFKVPGRWLLRLKLRVLFAAGGPQASSCKLLAKEASPPAVCSLRQRQVPIMTSGSPTVRQASASPTSANTVILGLGAFDSCYLLLPWVLLLSGAAATALATSTNITAPLVAFDLVEFSCMCPTALVCSLS